MFASILMIKNYGSTPNILQTQKAKRLGGNVEINATHWLSG